MLNPRSSLLRRLAPVLATAALAAIAAPTASAATTAPCGTRALTTPFAPWGDTSSYFLAPNGGFEHGLASMSASGGAGVVAGSEPYAVGRAGAFSGRIPAGGAILLDPQCLRGSENRLRLFVRAPQAAGSALTVQMARLAAGSYSSATVLTVRSGNRSGWYTPAAVSLWTQTSAPSSIVSLRFAVTGAVAAPWQIDDIYVDPWKCC